MSEYVATVTVECAAYETFLIEGQRFLTEFPAEWSDAQTRGLTEEQFIREACSELNHDDFDALAHESTFSEDAAEVSIS